MNFDYHENYTSQTATEDLHRQFMQNELLLTVKTNASECHGQLVPVR